MTVPQDTQQPQGPSRRSLIQGAAATGAFTLGFGALDGLVRAAAADSAGRTVGLGEGGYGKLRSVTRTDPETGTEVELMLPAGFDFAVFGLAGTTMDDGHVTPLGHDGMAAFPGPDKKSYRLVRNHEERTTADAATPSGEPGDRYDEKAGGGTSTLRVSFSRGTIQLESARLSLAGTIVNCAGGPTPWGSWITCEETTAGPGAGWERKHGYVFDVDASADAPVAPTPLPALGRFVHEAIAVDPDTGTVYLTEDRDNAGFYRFVPDTQGDLTSGKLQMLKITGEEGLDLRVSRTQGELLPVEWVDIADPDPDEAEENPSAVHEQGIEQGGATFARLEGCWWGNGAAYLVSTNGGELGEGQVFEYRPGDDTLALVYESTDRDVLSFPDNITVSPQGALLVCEDTSRSAPQLRGITTEGNTFPFCVDPSDDEWCGATFSHDGRVLFANLQGSTAGDPRAPETPGRTVAIWGPWKRGAL
ncbi:hypothetical protein F4561_003504 [Lipingzhangella halophila]|uniref:DUF839 domain-containing protein n=1 Tax=Lipingzhangella halophila TaxID=1783352 RepID=A0A7W7W4B8_9ACTN|nr:alkaline phosphatase PhoX [Lipingzhangella halophila]MBB4932684.1 hypothetical protein [Lipingzhangella halophila]